MEPTIDVSKLNFADWQLIAAAIGKDSKWAFYRWEDNGTIPPMTIEQWEEIGEEAGFNRGWAYHQYTQHREIA